MYFGRKLYFLTVADTQNITKAAQLLHVSQPSLTQYLNRLEQDVGAKLLDRSCSPIQLTEAGYIYLEYIKNSIALDNDFEKKLEQFKLRQSQTLSIGIPAQLTPLIFDSIVQNFIINHPDVKLSIKEGTSITVMQQLIREEVDIAFFHTKERKDDRFDRHLYSEENLFLACNRSSALAKGRRAAQDDPLIIKKSELENMENMRFLTTSKDYYLCHVMLDYIKELGVTPRETLEISHMDTIINYLMKPGSDGVSMLADFALRRVVNKDQLTFFKVEGHDLSWYLTINRRSNEPISKIAKQFWDESIKLNIDSRKSIS